MAHKHNRRRVRPRSKRARCNPLPTLYETSYDSLGLYSAPTFIPQPELSSKATLNSLLSRNGITVGRYWLDPLAIADGLSQQSRVHKLPDHEAGKMLKFGGEPGDDATLCDKMQEMFDGMDWIDT